jgi:hypothetical protein
MSAGRPWAVLTEFRLRRNVAREEFSWCARKVER